MIISVAFTDTKDAITKDLFSLKGVWYGHGIADRQFTNGWNVAAVPLISADLHMKLDQAAALYMKLPTHDSSSDEGTSLTTNSPINISLDESEVEVRFGGASGPKAFFLRAKDTEVKPDPQILIHVYDLMIESRREPCAHC